MRWRDRVLGFFACLWRGHSRQVVFSYLYRPGVLIDQSVIARCARCDRVLLSTTVRGTVTVGRYRMDWREP